MKVVVTGDFFQLPPVTKSSQKTKFAFEAKMWKATLKHTYNLTKVFRQSDPSKNTHQHALDVSLRI